MKKVLLKDLKPEQVLERLQKGEIIYHEIFPSISYKFINNILCKITFDGIVYNDGILVNDDNRYLYFKEEEPIKFEVGKHYKTRRGTEAICYAYDKCSYILYKFIELNTEVHINTYEDGKLYNTITNDLDIVDYWKD